MKLKYWIRGSKGVKEGDFRNLEDFNNYINPNSHINYFDGKNKDLIATIREYGLQPINGFYYSDGSLFNYMGFDEAERDKFILDELPTHFVFNVDKNNFISTDGKNYDHFFMEFSTEKLKEILEDEGIFEEIPEELFNFEKAQKALELICKYELTTKEDSPRVLAKFWKNSNYDDYLKEYDYDDLNDKKYELSFLEVAKEQIFYSLCDKFKILDYSLHSKIIFEAKDENDITIKYSDETKKLIEDYCIESYLEGKITPVDEEKLQDIFELDVEEMASKAEYIDGIREHIESSYYTLLEDIYKKLIPNLFAEYDKFLDKIEENYNGTLQDVSEDLFVLAEDYENFYYENDYELRKWLDDEAFQCGEDSSLGFVEKHLKVDLDDLTENNGIGFKRKLIEAFVYSYSCSAHELIKEYKEENVMTLGGR